MIELRNVDLELDGEVRLQNVNLKINDGDVVGIIGPSGAGKSLILRVMSLLEAPTKGEVILNGEAINEKAKDIHFACRDIGMCFQNARLFNHMTVLENIMRPVMDVCDFSKQEAYDIAIDMLKRVGLLDKQFAYPEQLTSGEKQRVAIMQVMALNPKILLFDDPTSNLDNSMKHEIERVIQFIANHGNTIVLVTSDIALAKKLCNRIVFVDEKTIYEEGNKQEFFASPKKSKTIEFLRGIDSLTIQIENPYADFLGIATRIGKFASSYGFGKEVLNKMYSCTEELCKHIVVEKLTNTKPFAINMVFDYDRTQHAVVFTMKYSGELFDPKDAEDELAFIVFNHTVGGYEHEAINDGDYTNKVTIKIPV